jgi:hypothetical protein
MTHAGPEASLTENQLEQDDAYSTKANSALGLTGQHWTPLKLAMAGESSDRV